MSSHVLVSKLPECDLCKTHPAMKDHPDLARFDAKTIHGPWANMCDAHWRMNTSGKLGTGYGQLLYTADDDLDALRAWLVALGVPAADEAEADDKLTTEQMRELYDVLGFAAPFVVVRRKSDSVTGSLEFTHNPRTYFNFKEDTK